MSSPRDEPRELYDRVTAAWAYLLGDDLHYGYFERADQDLLEATESLTLRLTNQAAIEPGQRVLDVGCGTGNPACWIVRHCGARVTGISTSETGIELARRRVRESGLESLATFELRDGMDTGFDDDSFDVVWVMESSHLVPRKDRLLEECARVLKRGGRLVLCDVIRRREIGLAEVVARRDDFESLKRTFGRATMEDLEFYQRTARDSGLEVVSSEDVTPQTRPTLAAWRENARRWRRAVVDLVGEAYLDDFVLSCRLLEELWDDGTLGYGIFAATKARINE